MRRSDFVTISVAAAILIGELPVFAQNFVRIAVTMALDSFSPSLRAINARICN